LLRINPTAAFCMSFILYISFFLVLSSILSYQTAMHSAVLAEINEIPLCNAVLIDPGHGGEDGGAVGIEGTLEKDLNLLVAQKISHVFHLFGFPTEMTRTEDVMLGDGGQGIAQKKVSDMHARLALINGKPYLSLLSIHMNSYPEEKYWGAQVFYSGRLDETKVYGTSIQNALKTFVSPENKREAKRAPDEIYLMKKAECPAMIIECGFISNRYEESLLKTNEHQIKIAAAVVAGFITGFQQYSNAA